jgi:hypothetical protein
MNMNTSLRQSLMMTAALLWLVGISLALLLSAPSPGLELALFAPGFLAWRDHDNGSPKETAGAWNVDRLAGLSLAGALRLGWAAALVATVTASGQVPWSVAWLAMPLRALEWGGIAGALLVLVGAGLLLGKGTARAAEVCTRFFLDAWPGRQMSIEAEWRAGQLSELGMRRRREALEAEARRMGALEGRIRWLTLELGLLASAGIVCGVGWLIHGGAVLDAASWTAAALLMQATFAAPWWWRVSREVEGALHREVQSSQGMRVQTAGSPLFPEPLRMSEVEVWLEELRVHDPGLVRSAVPHVLDLVALLRLCRALLDTGHTRQTLPTTLADVLNWSLMYPAQAANAEQLAQAAVTLHGVRRLMTQGGGAIRAARVGAATLSVLHGVRGGSTAWRDLLHPRLTRDMFEEFDFVIEREGLHCLVLDDEPAAALAPLWGARKVPIWSASAVPVWLRVEWVPFQRVPAVAAARTNLMSGRSAVPE